MVADGLGLSGKEGTVWIVSAGVWVGTGVKVDGKAVRFGCSVEARPAIGAQTAVDVKVFPQAMV